MGLLATIGATSPFVGLFGTVWGIMNSFIGISKAQTTNLAVVAPGIAEALLATAIGLVAAIPAVIIYNHFARVTQGLPRTGQPRLGRGGAAVVARSRPQPWRRRICARGGVGHGRFDRRGELDDDDDFAETHEINVTPFIDVMLVLLIIFMVAAPLSTVDLPIDLPSSTAMPQKKPDKPTYVSIKPDLALAIGENVGQARRPGRALDRHRRRSKDQFIFLRADRAVPYGELMDVMELLRTGGYQGSSWLRWKARRPAAAPATPGRSASPDGRTSHVERRHSSKDRRDGCGSLPPSQHWRFTSAAWRWPLPICAAPTVTMALAPPASRSRSSWPRQR